MVNIIQRRLLFLVTVVVSAASWCAVLPWLMSADGSSGLSLTTARIGFVAGVLLLAVAGIGAMVLGAATSAMGGRLSGVMAISLGLLVAAGRGGPIDGWIYGARTALPGSYLWLMVEVLVWQAGGVVMLLMVQKLRNPLTARWPALAYEDHLEVDVVVSWPSAATLGATVLCAVIAGVLSYWLVRNSDGGQVVGGVGVSFLVAAMITQLLMPKHPATGALFAPALVALSAYGYVLLRFANETSFLAGWYNLGYHSSASAVVPGPALALPVHYASAGVLGAAAGLAWARSMMAESSKPPAGAEVTACPEEAAVSSP